VDGDFIVDSLDGDELARDQVPSLKGDPPWIIIIEILGMGLTRAPPARELDTVMQALTPEGCGPPLFLRGAHRGESQRPAVESL
jgi:hypothetical protein